MSATSYRRLIDAEKTSCVYWGSKFTRDKTSFKIKYKLQKNYVVLVYDEKVLRHFWRIAIVTGVLPSRYPETKRSDSEN